MNSSLVLIGIALCCAFNFVVLIIKLRRRRYADFIVDCSIFVAICVLFSVSFNALVVGTFASAFISFWLLLFPVRFKDLTSPEVKKSKKKGKRRDSSSSKRSTSIEWV